MDDQHPITPPPELVEELQDLGNLDAIRLAYQAGADQQRKLDAEQITQAYKKGADQELEECCDAVYGYEGSPIHGGTAEWLRAERRPKPPTLKEQALAKTDAILNDPNRALLVEVRETLELTRRALDALPE